MNNIEKLTSILQCNLPIIKEDIINTIIETFASCSDDIKTCYWIKHTYDDGGYNYTCSNCYKYSCDTYRFCPNCSAFMHTDEATDDE